MRATALTGKVTHWALVLGALSMLAAGAAEAAPKAANKKVAAPTEEVVDVAEGDNDPIEPFNRAMFQLNYGLDTVVVRPVTQGYRYVMPDQGRRMVSNAVNNLYTPVVFANSVLQGDIYNSFATFWRFAINSTFGVFGLFDAATEVGLTNRTTDLGETFAFYGADTGPYLVLPLMGPTNVRDALGRAGDTFASPLTYADDWVRGVGIGVTVVDARSRNMKVLDDIYATSLDPYATMRSGFTQRRADTVKKSKKQRDASLKKTFGENCAKPVAPEPVQ
jgi:phospholipid-binding lipoprotein MlaA